MLPPPDLAPLSFFLRAVGDLLLFQRSMYIVKPVEAEVIDIALPIGTHASVHLPQHENGHPGEVTAANYAIPIHNENPLLFGQAKMAASRWDMPDRTM